MDAAREQRCRTDRLATQGDRILRANGTIDMAGAARRTVFEPVHRILEGDWQRP